MWVAFVSTISLHAQTVARKVIVEHFTNSRCGICANRNPALYTNLANNPNVLHIAYHPSSPYSTCVFSQHNPIENDARTNFYGVYGSTPKIAIQGSVQSASTNYASSTLFTPFQNHTSTIQLAINQTITNNELNVSVLVTNLSETSLTNPRIFVALAEEPIFYNAPNGENTHHDVFRKALTPANGVAFELPPVGTSVTQTFSTAINSAWDVNKLEAFAIIQNADTKEVLQVEKANTITSPVSETYSEGLTIFPNPTSDKINISTTDNLLEGIITIIDIQGKQVATYPYSERIDIAHLPKGNYLLRIAHKNKTAQQQFVKQ